MRRGTRWLPAAAPAGLAAALLLLGHPLRAGLLAATALVLALLIAIGVPVARGIERVAGAAGDLLWRVLLGLAFVVVLVPAWIADRARRGRTLDRARGWRVHQEPDAARPRLALRLAAVVGTVVVLLGLDYGVGWAWDARHAPRATGVVVQPRSGASDRSDAGGVGTTDPRAALPAMAAYPWAAAYFRDLEHQGFVQWPFTGVKPVDFTSPYINVDDWVRRSWEAPVDGARPTVWLFGGSGMFGEGQRDDHTIASEVARLAAADGVPVTVDNYGQRGWVHWQEMLLFEQRLAQVDAPDLAVFYDGPNDLSAAGRYGDGVPLSLNEYVDGDAPPVELSTQLLGGDDRSLPAELWDAYVEHSALRKVARWAGLVADPAGAQEVDPSGRKELPQETFTSEKIIDIGIGTYRRARDLTDHIAAEHGVVVRHFLQPQYYDDLEPWKYVEQHWPQPSIDLTSSVSARRDEVFIDGVHTNELGARLVAQAMWASLRPDVERWYAAHR